MIIMDIKLHNIFAFKNFHANFSYPKKIVNSNIIDEHLTQCPNFRYKRVNILMGANATGKTTLGKSLIAIFNFIQRNNPTLLIESAKLNDNDANISLDFVENNTLNIPCLYRVKINIRNNKSDAEPEVLAALQFVKINKTDNYETSSKKLDKKPYDLKKDVVTLFDAIPPLGWYFSDIDSKYLDDQNKKGDEMFIKVLKYVMSSFDNFITDIIPIEKNDLNSILIKFSTGEFVIYHNGEVMGKNILSKGTDSSIAIAEVITNVLLKKNGFYYCDEKFCYVQSDLEKSILSVLIELLGSDEQLFFTTHNTDILDLDLPKHSFSFLKKNPEDLNIPIKMISASKYLKKQTDSLRNAVENDLFSTAPDDSKIYKILELKERNL